MNALEKLKKRQDLFDAAIHGNTAERVPVLSNDFTWRLLDTETGVKFGEALRDFEKFRDITFEYQERYEPDCYVMAGMRNNIRMSDAVGGTHTIDDETGTIQSLDREYLLSEELGELNSDPIKTLWGKVAPRAFSGLTYRQLLEAIIASYDQYSVEDQIFEGLRSKYGVPESSAVGGFAPIEVLFNQYRGIKGVSQDMHRRKKELQEYCDLGEEEYVGSYNRVFEQGHRSAKPATVWDADVTMLAHSIMNPKQFEQFYWKSYKKIIDSAVENGCTILQFTEASILQFADFYQDIPDGVLTILYEKDDLEEAKKKLPNITIAGGFDSTLLGHGTPVECVEEAKRLIDQFYPKYVFSTNKMISFRTDCKRENLKAVMEFVLNYDPNNN